MANNPACINVGGFSHTSFMPPFLTGAIELTATGGTPTGCYATLKEAFDKINDGTHTGSIVININGNTTETATALLNGSGTGAANYSAVSIQPIGGTRTITGNLATPLIDLDRADNVTIDGRINMMGAISLTFSNTNTGGEVFRFINDATANTIRYCNIQGVNSSTTKGLIHFSTGETVGNDDNTIANCAITAGASTPANSIYSAGSSVGTDNSGISITNCNISNYFSASTASNGILVASNSSAWTITGNRFFQTATLTTTTASLTHRAINIITASGVGYTVSNNIIGYANSVGTGTTIYTGQSTLFRGIEMTVGTASVSNVQGNSITNISFSTTSGSTTLPGIFSGISVLAGNVNIGTTAGNTIGATTGTGSIQITSTTSLGVITGIYTTTTGSISIQNNSIGSMNTGGAATIGYAYNGIYTAGTGGNFTITSNTVGSTTTANSIAVGTDGTTTTPVCTFRGIYNLATGIISITNNTVQNCSAYGTGASVFNGILNGGGTGTLDLSSNNIISGTNTGTGIFVAITNSAAVATANLNNNIIRNLTKTAATGTFTALSNTGAVLSHININNNQLGNASGGLITYAAANSAALLGISNSAGAASCELSIQNNDIRGIVHDVAGTNAHTYIINSAATFRQDINTNTFTNLNVNTSGAIIFLSNNVIMPTNGIQNVNNNAIVTAFNRGAASGAITLFTSTASTNNTGVTVNNTGNNFSNITINGAATIAGWVNTDAGTGSPNKTISGNTFGNWTGGTGSITAMNLNITSENNRTKSNTINNFNSAGILYGIITGAGSDSIYSNTITAFNSTGGAAATIVSGINITAGTTKNVFNNTISNLTGNTLTTGSVRGILVSSGTTVNVFKNTVNGIYANANTTGTVSGIWVSGGTFVNIDRNKIYDVSSTSTVMSGAGTVQGVQVSGSTANLVVTISNNIIGDIKSPAMSATNVLRGISVISTGTTSTTNVYYNTIYLTATSTGANFGSSGIHHTVSTTATTGALDMRNNIIVNLSTPSGSGQTVAYRRSAGTANSLNNYASTSNNNLFYAGTPGATRFIYHDGTSSAQTLAAYKSGVFTAGTISPRDQASVTENVAFVSTTPASADFLKINPVTVTQIESGAVNIATFTIDFDDQVRQGNAGYAGASTTAPDIGADEGDFTPVDVNAPSITYSLIANNSCLTNQTFTAIINDATGVNTSPGTKPRVWFKKSTNNNSLPATNTNTTNGWKYAEATNSSSPFSFTIDYSQVFGGVASGDVIQYFVIAQDIVDPTPYVGINAGNFAATPTSVALTSAAFPIGGTINSYNILAGLTGTKTIGAAGDYTSITGAGGLFSDINAKGLAGNLVVRINDASVTETGAVSLNPILYGCASNYTLTIRPNDGVAAVLSGSIAGPLINLNGADQVVFDGINSGGSSLTISNTSTATTASTIRFIADATGNTITNCTLEGAGTGTASGVIFFSTGTATGNDGNLISNNIIKPPGTDLPTNGIYSAGSTVFIDNSSNTISNNRIQDYYNASLASNGIFLASNSSAWTISGNKLFQTANRTATAGNIHRGINIVTALGVGYNITNNIIGYANESSTGTTTYDGAFNNRFFGIQLTVGITEVSNVQGNIVAGINLSNTVGTAVTAAPGIFTGITVLAGSVDIGTTSGNTIGQITGTGSITISSSITLNYIAGIYATSTSIVNIQNNKVASISTGGASNIGYTFHGINAAGGGQFNISDNYIGSDVTANSIAIGTNGTTTTGVCTLNGISNASTGGVTISGNTVKNVSSFGTAASVLTGIVNSGVANSVTISDNSIISTNNTGTGTMTGISNTAAATTVVISENIIRNLTKTVATGAVTVISNSGGVLSSISITDNHLGNTSGGLITYGAANSSTLTGISNSAGSANCALSIQNNDIRGITYSVAGTNANTYIINSAATLSQNTSGNTYTNLSVNTTGAITFLSNNVAMPANGTQTISNNSIAGTFARTATSGAITLFTSTTATNNSNVTVTHSNNNFSNITIAGAATISGWVNTDAGTGLVNKTISGNTFSNWTSTGTGTITALNVNITSTNNAVSNNTISNITSVGTIYGITTGAGNDNIFSNTTHTLVSTGATASIVNGIAITTTGSTKNVYLNTIYGLQANNISTGSVSGIAVTGGTTNNIYRNKIYNISSSSSSLSTGTVSGIMVSGTTTDVTTTLHNNRIGDIRATVVNAANALRGINIASTGVRSATNVYFNTIYLNATSSGVDFGSSGIYHEASAIASTSTLRLRNNIIVNLSTPNGTGLTVAYRRSVGTSNTLNNYSSVSNNNLFYTGIPDATRLIYSDGTSSADNLTAYKSGVFTAGSISPRDQLSISESPVFLSTDGASTDFLKINTTSVTFIESGAVNISGITVDLDGDVRAGNPGFPSQSNGAGTAPDIGADEFDGKLPSVVVLDANIYSMGNFATLASAFSSINAYDQTGKNILVRIIGNTTEPASATLNTGAWTTLKIFPTVANLTLTGSIAAPLIDLNGADNVTLDGRVNQTGSTRSLTVRNTSTSATSGTSTIRFLNSAENNTVKYCIVSGSTTSATGGVISFSTSSAGNGNDNNIVEFCNITNASGNRPLYAIYSEGSAGSDNSGITIRNNNIFDFLNPGASSCGIHLKDYTSAWSITSNSFYETASLEPTAGSYTHGAIRIDNASGINFTVSSNFIGGKAASAGGGAWTVSSSTDHNFRGIWLNVGTGTASSVQGNTIRNWSYTTASTTPWRAIEVGSGAVNVGTSTGNIIGADTGTGSITVTASANAESCGVYVSSSGTVSVSKNTIGSISIFGNATDVSHSFSGVYKSGVAGAVTVSNNTIGSATTTNSIQAGSAAATSTAPQHLRAIFTEATGTITMNLNIIANLTNAYAGSLDSRTRGIHTTAGTSTLTKNTIYNISSASLGTTEGAVIGIEMNGTDGANTLTENVIYNLSNTNTGFTGYLAGIYFTGSSGSNLVNRNFIRSITAHASSVNASIYGIRMVSGATTYANNIISLGGDTQTTIYGFYCTGTSMNNSNLYFNTVYIGGNLGSGVTNKSYALFSAVNSNTRDFRNNIFSNFRSTSGGASLHYGIYFNYNGSSGLTVDYNIYYASGTGGVPGFYNGSDDFTIPIVNGQDGNSYIENPNFINPGGPTAADYKVSASVFGIYGTGIILDYSQTARGNPPNIGAWEFNANRWLGSVSTDFADAANWTSGAVPIDEAPIVFDLAPANDCILDQDRIVGNIVNNQSDKKLIINGKRLTLVGGLFFTNGGKIDATTANSALVFAGGEAQTIPDSGFVSNLIPRLTVDNQYGVISQSDLTISDSLNLLSANAADTLGSLHTGTKTITLGANAVFTGDSDISGIVQITTVVAEKTYLLGNKYTTIYFPNTGTLPSTLGVKISLGQAPSWRSGGVKRVYEITQTGAIAGDPTAATITSAYLDSELNGNDEERLAFWSYRFGPNLMYEHGRANHSTSNNWVKLTNINMAFFPSTYGTLQIGFDEGELDSLVWNGSASNSWTTVNNWTPNGAPSDYVKVIIPDAATTTFDPSLPFETTITSLKLKNGAILNSFSDAQATIIGGENAWKNEGGTFNPSTSNITFTNELATISGATSFYNVTISSGATLTMKLNSTMRLSGAMNNIGNWFTAAEGATTVEYNGSDQTVVIPNPVTIRYYNLVLSGSGTKTMPGSILNINGDFTLSGTVSATASNHLNITGALSIGASTTFTAGAFNHTIGGNFTHDGTFTATGSTIGFNGTVAQTIGGSAATATVFNNLSILNTDGVTSARNLTVNGILDLASDNPTATKGGLDMGALTLTLGASATTTGVGDVSGIVKRNHSFTTNVFYTFGSRSTSVTFGASGTKPTEVSIKATLGTAPSWKSTAVQRVYDIIHTGGSNCLLDLSLKYQDSELNSNVETDLVFWRAVGLPSPTTTEFGRTEIDTALNAVLTNSVSIDFLPTSFGSRAFTLAATGSPTLTWNGSQGTDWEDARNWTPNGFHSEFTTAIIPNASGTPNDPIVPLTAKLRSLTLNSGSILDAAAGAALSMYGQSGAVWTNSGGTFNPSTSTVVFRGSGSQISGSTNFYHLSIATDADLTLLSGSSIGIAGTLLNDGTLDATLNANTIIYNGAAQTVIVPNGVTPGYHHLTLSGGDVKTMPGTSMSIFGNFTLAGSASATSGTDMTINGNVAINGTAAWSTGNFDHTIKGNFENNATFNAATGKTITLSGTSIQSILGTAASTFKKLEVSNTAHVSLSTSISVDEILTLTTGNLIVNSTTLGINGTILTTSGKINVSSLSSLNFGGTSTIALNNDLFVTAPSINDLTVNRSGGVTLNNQSMTVNGVLALTAGTLNLAANTFTMAGSSITRTSGNINASNASATVVFANAASITLPASSFTGAINNLTLSGAGGVISSGDLTVNGILNLQSANPSATSGILRLGSNTLNMGESATTIGTGDVTGIVKRTHSFTTGVAYTFGSQFTTMAFQGTGTKPGWVSCKISIGTAPAWRSTAVKRQYSFAKDAGDDQVDVKLHYLDSELNLLELDESSLVFWDVHNLPTPSSTVEPHGKTDNNSTDNWVSLLGLSIDYFAPTSTLDDKFWGLSYNNSVITWTGAGIWPGDWSLVTNWLGGLPTADDDVLIPTGIMTSYPFENRQPGLFPAVAKSITIETGASITVDDYDITVAGDVGAWDNSGDFTPGDGTVFFTNANATISGETNFNNLTINTGAGLTTETGSITRIAGTLTINGTLDATTYPNTIEFNGASQAINYPNGGSTGYHHLSLSGSGTKTLSEADFTIFGNLTVNDTAAASLDTNMVVEGNLAVGASGIFTIEAGKTLTVVGTITNSAGNAGLVLKSTAAGTASLIHNTNSVPATVQRYISGNAEDWHFLSSPVSNQSISGGWIPSGTYGNGTGYDLYMWHEPTPCWVYHLNTTVTPTWPVTHTSTDFVPGQGYLYSVQAANPTKEFAGNLNNGNLTYPLTFESPDLDLKGFNLIGNPYPSSIDWRSASGWTRTNLLETGGGYDLWIWNPAANNYGVINSAGIGAGTNGATRHIAPMQGFFVRAASSGNIGLTNDTRVHDGASGWFLPPNFGKLTVQVESAAGNGFDEVLLQFGYPKNEPGAAKIFSPKSDAPSLYMTQKGKDLSVRYFTNTAENPTVPLHFKPGSNGLFTFSANFDYDEFDYLLLDDKKLKVTQNLKDTITYQFEASVQDAPDRFVLHFAPKGTQPGDKLPARIFYEGNELVIDLSFVDASTEVKIIDVLGRVVLQTNLDGNQVHRLTPDTKNQVVVVNATSGKKSFNQKVFAY